MIVHPHYWSVRLATGNQLASMQFLHQSQPTGLQVLDELAWPMSLEALTEGQILSELYAGVLDFLEVRG